MEDLLTKIYYTESKEVIPKLVSSQDFKNINKLTIFRFILGRCFLKTCLTNPLTPDFRKSEKK